MCRPKAGCAPPPAGAGAGAAQGQWPRGRVRQTEVQFAPAARRPRAGQSGCAFTILHHGLQQQRAWGTEGSGGRGGGAHRISLAPAVRAAAPLCVSMHLEGRPLRGWRVCAHMCTCVCVRACAERAWQPEGAAACVLMASGWGCCCWALMESGWATVCMLGGCAGYCTTLQVCMCGVGIAWCIVRRHPGGGRKRSLPTVVPPPTPCVGHPSLGYVGLGL